MRVSHIDQEFKDLKPCPFCGSKPIWWLKGNEFTKSQIITVKCPKCRIQREDGIINGHGHDINWLEDVAIKNWNMRTEKKEEEE